MISIGLLIIILCQIISFIKAYPTSSQHSKSSKEFDVDQFLSLPPDEAVNDSATSRSKDCKGQHTNQPDCCQCKQEEKLKKAIYNRTYRTKLKQYGVKRLSDNPAIKKVTKKSIDIGQKNERKRKYELMSIEEKENQKKLRTKELSKKSYEKRQKARGYTHIQNNLLKQYRANIKKGIATDFEKSKVAKDNQLQRQRRLRRKIDKILNDPKFDL